MFDQERPPPCPRAFPVADARALTRYTGQGRDLTDVIFEARIEDVALICDYDDGVIEPDGRAHGASIRLSPCQAAGSAAG